MQVAYPRTVDGLLRLGGDRRGEEATRQGSDEPPPIYHSIT